MLPKSVKLRAEDIVFEDGVDLQQRYINYHWRVLQRSGEWADVFLIIKNGKINWSCCAVDKKKGLGLCAS